MAGENMLDRRDAVTALLAERGDALVVTGLGSPTYDVHAAGDHDGNYYLWGAMGGAALVGLGLAQARPDRPVIVMTGDGEQLMGLGGQRSVLLMQSSGVGNCINMLSLPAIGRFPLLMLVTMRGEWAEFNPWQVPMSRATQPTLEAMGVRVMRAEEPDGVAEIVDAAAALAYEADGQVGVLLGQRLLGRKKW